MMSERRALFRSDRTWLLTTGLGAAAIAIALGVPTVLIDTPFFRRMTPTRWWDYAFWATAAVVGGLTIAARRLPRAGACHFQRSSLAGGGLTFLAIGCPICNKLVVWALGVSGALNFFAPLQPILGIAGVILMLLALRRALLTIKSGSMRVMPATPG